jgi:hypothetical protein
MGHTVRLSRLHELLFGSDLLRSTTLLPLSELSEDTFKHPEYKQCVTEFNTSNSGKAIKKMVEVGVLPNLETVAKRPPVTSPCHVARLLFAKSNEFDREKVGEYLSESGKFESAVLGFYLRYLDLPTNGDFVGALRKYVL